MLIPLTWRALYLGSSKLTFATRAGVAIALDLADGGGFCASVAVWRVAGQAVHVVQAARC